MASLNDLYRQYRDSLAAKRNELRLAWDGLCDEAASLDRVVHLHLLLHRLAGSAGTYGYADLARAALSLEQGWSAWLDAVPQERPEPYVICARQAGAMAQLLSMLSVAAKE